MGAIRVPAALTRSGVFAYHTADGRVIREYRPPAEVAKADALRTIEDMPVTIGHPPGGVSTGTWGARSVGHVRGDTVRTDASAGPVDVTAKLVIARKDAIEALELPDANPAKLVDTSCGYMCELVHTPGKTDAGEEYDAIQTSMKYNHVALLRRGDGRLGTTIRADGAGEVGAPVMRLDAAGNQITAHDGAQEGPEVMKVKIDGKDFEGDAAAIQAEIDRVEKDRADARAKLDAAAKERATADAKAAAERRTALEARARKVIGKADAKFDGQTDRAIKEACVRSKDSAAKFDGEPDAYVDGRFDALFGKEEESEEEKKKKAEKGDAANAARTASPEVQALVSDSGTDTESKLTKARADATKAEADALNAWRRK